MSLSIEKSSLTPNPGTEMEIEADQIGTKSSNSDLSKGPDFLLAKMMNQLSVQEREKVYYDIHGVSGAVQERPKFLGKRLVQLDLEIIKLASHPNALAYRLAESQNPDYIADASFRLKFLRAELYDPPRAANRLIGFFAEKLKLFGMERLTSDITLENMDSADYECAESGILQLLPLTDQSGRAVILWSTVLRTEKMSLQSRVSIVLL